MESSVSDATTRSSLNEKEIYFKKLIEEKNNIQKEKEELEQTFYNKISNISKENKSLRDKENFLYSIQLKSVIIFLL